MPRGRPSAYKPEFAEQAAKLCELGATDYELAKFFKVNTATIYRWRNSIPEFCKAVTCGKAMADARVERAVTWLRPWTMGCHQAPHVDAR